MSNDIAKMIDHTLLKANATMGQIKKLCEEAVKYGFASVCINPGYVAQAAELLEGSQVKVCTVIGFPLGANIPETKLFEAEHAMQLGARELDYVLNVSQVLNNRMDLIEHEMKLFAGLRDNVCKPVIKVILETCYLTEGQIVEVCRLAKKTNLDFVKTSTGFGPAGAVTEHVRLMRSIVGQALGVKASGGIRSYEDARAMIAAGADRIGTSAGIEIVSGA